MAGGYASIGEDLRRLTARLFADVQDAFENVLNQEKSRVADTVGSVAGLLRETARQFDEQHIETVARLADNAALEVEHASSTLRNRSLESILADGEDFIRRRPGWFVAGAVVTGFLASRLLRRPR